MTPPPEVFEKCIEAAACDPTELSYILDSSVCSTTFDEVGSHWRAGPIGGVAAGGLLGLGTAAGVLRPVSLPAVSSPPSDDRRLSSTGRSAR
jgi:hypothetical protein